MRSSIILLTPGPLILRLVTKSWTSLIQLMGVLVVVVCRHIRTRTAITYSSFVLNGHVTIESDAQILG
jgi:hypothetical protein